MKTIKYLKDQDIAYICGGKIPNGLKGYEGQPGNQGGPKHHP